MSFMHLFDIDYLRELTEHKVQILSQPSGRSPSPRNYVWLCDDIYPNCAEHITRTTAVRSQEKQLVYTKTFWEKLVRV